MLYILVMKIMLIIIQGMYTFPQYSFSQLPKIKTAFNSYIYKYSDSSLNGYEGCGNIILTIWTSNFSSVCLPRVPFKVSLQCVHALR